MPSDIQLDQDRLIIKGDVVFEDLDGNKGLLRLEGDNGGTIIVEDAGGHETLRLTGNEASVLVGGNGATGSLTVQDRKGGVTLAVDAEHGRVEMGAKGRSGMLTLRDDAGDEAARLDSAGPSLDLGGGISTIGARNGTAALHLGLSGKPGVVEVGDDAGKPTVTVHGAEARVQVGAKDHAGVGELVDAEGRPTLRLDAAEARCTAGTKGNAGDVEVQDGAGRAVVLLAGAEARLQVGAKDHAGKAALLDTGATETVRLDGATGHADLQGSGCAEEFELAQASEVEPGTVMVIDEKGKLRPCEQEFDRRVAGVVAGGEGVVTGLALDRRGGDKRAPVVVAGKVFCKVDATDFAVEPGDLLTSGKKGHAMKADIAFLPVVGDVVADLPVDIGKALQPFLDALALSPGALRAFGATIGKALAPLAKGKKGTIPILVALQ